MRRREFITLLGGAAVWPLAARAQQSERMRRIGVLMPYAEDNPVGQARLAAFLEGLRQLGWADGRNVRIDSRWGAGDASLTRTHARELVAPGPDVVMAVSSGAVAPLREVTRSVPIVFAVVADAVGAGFVESLVRPGGNVTGFTAFEYAVSGKWLELLKEIVLERAIGTFAKGSNNGLIVTGSPSATIHRNLIITLAARHRLPAVYYDRFYVTGGGLLSYGADTLDECRRAAGYVDRILKGEKPADLPVQAPVKYELAINLKTAKALGLEVPPSVLARADEVIE
jgi:putative ABC transport system substrate-binding protein